MGRDLFYCFLYCLSSCTSIAVLTSVALLCSAGILEQSGAKSRVGIGLSNRPARLNRLAESIPGLLKSLKIPGGGGG